MVQKDNLTYTSTHARAGAWLIGVLLGYAVFKTSGKKINVSKTVVAFAWLSTITVLLIIIFGQFHLQQENFQGNPLYADAIYESLRRVFWAICISWVIFACIHGYGGFVNQFLSLPVWIPISKLSFCIYLLHLPIQLLFLSSIRNPQYFSNLRATHKFLGDLSITFMISICWSLAFEHPIMNLISIFFGNCKEFLLKSGMDANLLIKYFPAAIPATTSSENNASQETNSAKCSENHAAVMVTMDTHKSV